MDEYTEIEKLRVDLELAEARANLAIRMVTALVYSLNKAGVTEETAELLSEDFEEPGAFLYERPEHYYAIMAVTDGDPREYGPVDIEADRAAQERIREIRQIMLKQNREEAQRKRQLN